MTASQNIHIPMNNIHFSDHINFHDLGAPKLTLIKAIKDIMEKQMTMNPSMAYQNVVVEPGAWTVDAI